MDDGAILDGLNERQHEAVVNQAGPLLVLAGAGSGKTRVLAHRVAWGLARGLFLPDGFLAVTFTNKAAAEMRARIAGLAGLAGDGLWVRTFHAACAAILRRSGPAIGVPRDFVIYDENDQLAVLRAVLEDAAGLPERCTPHALLARIARAKDDGLDIPPDGGNDPELSAAARAVAGRYGRRMAEAGALDFGDLLVKVIRLFEERPEELERWRARFQRLLVDEFQDANRAQYRLVRLLAGQHRAVCAVGDDDQSIYGWRGADAAVLRDFLVDFPEAGVVKLERNYRSAPEILRLAAAVIEHNPSRLPKTVYSELAAAGPATYAEAPDDRAEAAWVATHAARLADEGESLAAIAVFVRTNWQCRAFEEQFVARGIPYRVAGGSRFYDRREVRDLLAWLRLAANGHDLVACVRAAAAPPRGIGEKTLAKVAAWAAGNGMDLVAACADAGRIPGLRSKAAALAAFRAAVEAVRAAPTPGDAALAALEAGGLLAASDDDDERRGTLLEFAGAVRRAGEERPGLTLVEFLGELALLGGTDDAPGERAGTGRGVQLMTLHNAKGLEFDTVFLTGLEDGLLPHFLSAEERGDLEEERRLFYVGVTRARRRLFLSSARQRLAYGKVQDRTPSPFLAEIPADLVVRDDAFPARQGGLPGNRPVRDAVLPGPPLVIGDAVRHPQYGPGVVVDRRGAGPLAQVQVEFAGQRYLFLELYAQLERRGDEATATGETGA